MGHVSGFEYLYGYLLADFVSGRPRAANFMMKSDQDREFYSLFFTKISRSESATHFVQHLYQASETPFDLTTIEKALNEKTKRDIGLPESWRFGDDSRPT